MITEEQRRALHALREALRLCEGAKVTLTISGNDFTSFNIGCGEGRLGAFSSFESEFVESSFVSTFLAEYPEP